MLRRRPATSSPTTRSSRAGSRATWRSSRGKPLGEGRAGGQEGQGTVGVLHPVHAHLGPVERPGAQRAGRYPGGEVERRQVGEMVALAFVPAWRLGIGEGPPLGHVAEGVGGDALAVHHHLPDEAAPGRVGRHERPIHVGDRRHRGVTVLDVDAQPPVALFAPLGRALPRRWRRLLVAHVSRHRLSGDLVGGGHVGQVGVCRGHPCWWASPSAIASTRSVGMVPSSGRSPDAPAPRARPAGRGAGTSPWG